MTEIANRPHIRLLPPLPYSDGKEDTPEKAAVDFPGAVQTVAQYLILSGAKR